VPTYSIYCKTNDVYYVCTLYFDVITCIAVKITNGIVELVHTYYTKLNKNSS